MLAGLGVVAFSLTFPATAWGLESFGPGPWWPCAACSPHWSRGVLLAARVPLPARRHWAGLAVVGAGSWWASRC